MGSDLIQVSDMVKRSVSLSEINFAMAGYLLSTDLIFAQVTFGHLSGPWFGLMSPASRSKVKRQKGDRSGGINIEDLMVKCRQKIVLGALEGRQETKPKKSMHEQSSPDQEKRSNSACTRSGVLIK